MLFIFSILISLNYSPYFGQNNDKNQNQFLKLKKLVLKPSKRILVICNKKKTENNVNQTINEDHICR